jgi:transposase-like protein
MKEVEMPWLETAPMEQRERFIADHQRALYAMSELCDRYGISRKTSYKWLERFDEEGMAGLRDRSHAPHVCPHRTGNDMAALLCYATSAPVVGAHQAARLAAASREKASPGSAGVDGPFSTQESCPFTPSLRTISGLRTSRVTSGRATQSTAIR